MEDDHTIDEIIETFEDLEFLNDSIDSLKWLDKLFSGLAEIFFKIESYELESSCRAIIFHSNKLLEVFIEVRNEALKGETEIEATHSKNLRRSRLEVVKKKKEDRE